MQKNILDFKIQKSFFKDKGKIFLLSDVRKKICWFKKKSKSKKAVFLRYESIKDEKYFITRKNYLKNLQL